MKGGMQNMLKQVQKMQAEMQKVQAELVNFHVHAMLHANQNPSVCPLFNDNSLRAFHQASGNTYPLARQDLDTDRIASLASNPRVGLIRSCH